MDPSFYRRNRRTITDFTENLRHMADNLNMLVAEMERHVNRPPPPPPPPSRRTAVSKARHKGSIYTRAPPIGYTLTTPHEQFRRQGAREYQRLMYQEDNLGRKKTLPPGPGDIYTVKKNAITRAYYNVRARWEKYGIWREEWGQEVTPYFSTWPSGGWGHEYDPEAEFDPTTIASGTFDPAASRPFEQFLLHFFIERQWLIDEQEYEYHKKYFNLQRCANSSTDSPQYEWVRKDPQAVIEEFRPRNAENLAYLNARRIWIQDGIWDPKWDKGRPFEIKWKQWKHEELNNPAQEEARDRTSNPAQGEARDRTDNPAQEGARDRTSNPTQEKARYRTEDN